MTWTDAPAGFFGAGSAAVRPYACRTVVAGGRVVMAPLAAPVDGTGVPAAARLRLMDGRGTASVIDLNDIDITGVGTKRVDATAPISTTTENNGTTLGIHPPGRPQS